MNTKDLRLFSLAALVGVAACGDSGTDVTADLSQAEAQALAEVVAASAFSSAAYIPEGPSGAPSRVAWEETASIEAEDFPCELGGTVTVSGSVTASGDDETGESEATLSLVQIHDGCVAASEDGTRFTLTGAPQVSADLYLSVSEEALSLDGEYGGAVDWETDGRSGTCPIDIDIAMDVNVTAESGSVTMGGSVCGVSISRSITFG